MAGCQTVAGKVIRQPHSAPADVSSLLGLRSASPSVPGLKTRSILLPCLLKSHRPCGTRLPLCLQCPGPGVYAAGKCLAKYWACEDMGIAPTVMTCAPGTVFNPANSVCDWEQSVADCQSHIGPVSSMPLILSVQHPPHPPKEPAGIEEIDHRSYQGIMRSKHEVAFLPACSVLARGSSQWTRARPPTGIAPTRGPIPLSNSALLVRKKQGISGSVSTPGLKCPCRRPQSFDAGIPMESNCNMRAAVGHGARSSLGAHEISWQPHVQALCSTRRPQSATRWRMWRAAP